MVNTTWFRFDSIRFRKYFSACRIEDIQHQTRVGYTISPPSLITCFLLISLPCSVIIPQTSQSSPPPPLLPLHNEVINIIVKKESFVNNLFSFNQSPLFGIISQTSQSFPPPLYPLLPLLPHHNKVIRSYRQCSFWLWTKKNSPLHFNHYSPTIPHRNHPPPLSPSSPIIMK